MTERNQNEATASKKERFEFILTINGNIVCQRYFRINGFRNRSLVSQELVDTIDRCVEIIDNDLKAKTHIYHQMCAPQIYDTKEDFEKWLNVRNYVIMPYTFIAFRDSDEVLVWDGETATPYTNRYNASDFIEKNDENSENVLKFAFLDNGVEVCSKVWDGNVYPRFVRSNIDLSNSRNKYRGGDVYAPVEIVVIDKFISELNDLIPSIVKEIYTCCSNPDDDFYTTSDYYGDTEYNFDIQNANYRLMRSYERKYRKKTEEYFGRK